MSTLFSKLISTLIAIWYMILSLFGLGPGVSAPEVPVPDEPQYKNVIFMIGDGMGFNSINKAVSELGLEHINLERMPYLGQSMTHSANNNVTDSAAGGTALACGVKVNNSTLGVYPSDLTPVNSYPENLSEMFMSLGKSAGIVTTDNNYGATPAAFSIHCSSRYSSAEITEKQLSSNLNLIWSYTSNIARGYDIEGAGFDLIQTKDDMNKATSATRSFGLFAHSIWHSYDYKDMPSLAQLTTKAIDILDDNNNGFFLMVEGAHIDKNSHNNNGEGMDDAFKAFDEAIGAALDYAEKTPGTVVIVTADHETGGITLNSTTGIYEYTRTSHSGVNVPLYVYGSDDIITNGEIVENTEIPTRTARLFGVTDFPKEITIAASLNAAA